MKQVLAFFLLINHTLVAFNGPSGPIPYRSSGIGVGVYLSSGDTCQPYGDCIVYHDGDVDSATRYAFPYWDYSTGTLCSSTTPCPSISPFEPGFGAMRALSQREHNLYSVGLDPANLIPEALDLNIFPSIPISSELSLKPSLSYTAQNLYAKRGDLQYGSPKRWQNHYGELIFLVPRTDKFLSPLGFAVQGSGSLNEESGLLEAGPSTGQEHGEGPRSPVPVEVLVYFVNAEGQEVGFYPDPDQFGDGTSQDAFQPQSGGITQWFSESGNYRLNRFDDTAGFGYTIKTPNGLTFTLTLLRGNHEGGGEGAGGDSAGKVSFVMR